MLNKSQTDGNNRKPLPEKKGCGNYSISTIQAITVGTNNAINSINRDTPIKQFISFPIARRKNSGSFSRKYFLRSAALSVCKQSGKEMDCKRWINPHYRANILKKHKEQSTDHSTQDQSVVLTSRMQAVDDSTLNAIINHSPDGIIVINAAHKIIFANPAAGSIYEKNLAELTGQHCGFVPACKTNIVFNPIEFSNTANLIEAHTVEIQWMGRDAFLSMLRPIPLSRQDGVIGLEFYSRLDTDGRILESNSPFSAYLSRVGFNPGIRKIFDLFSIQDRLNFEIEIEALQSNNSRGYLQTTLVRENDSPIHIDWELRAITNKQDQTFEIEAIGREQTGLNQLNEKLDVSQSIIENATDGILLCDQKGRIISINKSFSLITGYRLKEITGKSINLLHSSLHSDDFYDSIQRQVDRIGFWQGELSNRRKNGETFPSWLTIQKLQDGLNRTTNYIYYLRDITEKKIFETEYIKGTTLDPLTDLPNRAQFIERLTQALSRAKRNSEKAVVMYLDLDRFKVINDNYGHEIGDLLLKQVSERLKSISRMSDTIARMGGDEFTILLVGPSIAPIVFAQKVLGVFANPFKVNEYEFYVTCSIGISIFPDDGEDVSTIMKNSDLAMYKAKELGRNYFQFFSPELNERAHRQMDMGANLRRAIVEEEFTLDFQPIVEANSGRIISIEALIRWENSEIGRVFPDTFIPLAESTGLIVPIGDWVLNSACKQARGLYDSGWTDLSVAVNISGLQLERDEFVDSVRNALNQTGLPPENLVLEITESLLMKNVKRTRKILQELRSTGVKISIDDFGTGYSSLNSLMVLPINTIKIDKSFILEFTQNPQNLTLVQGIIQIGHNLNLKVVAEGVETNEQAALLRCNECDELQGYYFSTPLSFEKLVNRLNITRGLLG